MSGDLGGEKEDLLRIVLQCLDRTLQSSHFLLQHPSLVFVILWLDESIHNLLLVLCDLQKELFLELFLGLAHKEVANEPGDRLAHRPDCNLEEGLNPRSQRLHEHSSTFVTMILWYD